MKKLAVLVMVGLLVAAFATPVSALENVFGGYWRTRLYTQRNFTGEDQTEAMDITRVDTRTRLYYTAILNDNLRFVNKFEMNAKWGGPKDGYGDIGADGTQVKVKNSYVDFSIGSFNAKVGVQGGAVARGLIFDDDFSGATLSFGGGGFTLPITWVKAFDQDDAVLNGNQTKRDVDYLVVSPSFKAGGMEINPFGMYVFSDNASTWAPTENYNDVDIWYAGLNLDADMGPVSFWATGIYQGGELEVNTDGSKRDIKAYLGAAGLGFDMGAADLHGQFVYASGQDDDEDITGFFVPKGQSYYWSEIMGLGVFDNTGSNNAPEDKIGNIMFANLGTTFKASDLKISLDAWWAKLAEKDANGNEDLGIEANVKITYTLVEGLNLDLIGAYLFADDATYSGNDDADPYEIGTRLSLSF
jgi:hypothetical protein